MNVERTAGRAVGDFERDIAENQAVAVVAVAAAHIVVGAAQVGVLHSEVKIADELDAVAAAEQRDVLVRTAFDVDGDVAQVGPVGHFRDGI